MPRRKSNTKLFTTLLVAAVLLLGGGVFAWNATRADDTNDIPATTDTPTNTTNTPTNDNSGSTSTEPKKPKKADDGTPIEDEPDTSPASNKSVTITAALYDTASSKAIVKAVVKNVTSGTCKAIFSKSGQSSITKTAPVTVVTSYYACGSLSVERSKFPKSGTWSVKVQLIEEGSVSANSGSQTITIQ